jgi:hypothetical protein
MLYAGDVDRRRNPPAVYLVNIWLQLGIEQTFSALHGCN